MRQSNYDLEEFRNPYIIQQIGYKKVKNNIYVKDPVIFVRVSWNIPTA